MIEVHILDQGEHTDWEATIFVFADINTRSQPPVRKREKFLLYWPNFNCLMTCLYLSLAGQEPLQWLSQLPDHSLPQLKFQEPHYPRPGLTPFHRM